jgi:hypothetical protein
MTDFSSLQKDVIKFNRKTDTHGWIQWKGTEVCIDIICRKCNHHTHFDGYSMYYIQCPYCKTVYEANGHIELIEVSNITKAFIKIAEKDPFEEESDKI